MTLNHQKMPTDITYYEMRSDLPYNEQFPAHFLLPDGGLVGYSPRGDRGWDLAAALGKYVKHAWWQDSAALAHR